MTKAGKRNTQGLRDVLFDEIDALRNGDGDTARALAVANLAKQIINVAKVEIDYLREITKMTESGISPKLGTMELGSAPTAQSSTTGH